MKKFTHDNGSIEVTKENNILKVNPVEKDGEIHVNTNQSKESLFQEIEDKLNLIYVESPEVVKDFITWLEVVI
ncbi:MAG: hypothetical protein Q8936_14735 [Bacillota bacterium]|nr:hypothetical protein [Bacillota bacterium]